MRIVVAVLVSVSATVVMARPSTPEIQAEYSQEYHACADASDGVTSELRACSAAEHARLDVKLNREYRAALARLPNRSARETLRRSERAWLRNRYDHCAEEAEEERGGTLWLILMDSCSLEAVAARVVWLRHYQG